jgi:hypothetical protein
MRLGLSRLCVINSLSVAVVTLSMAQPNSPTSPPPAIRIRQADVAALRGIVAAPGFGAAISNGTLLSHLRGRNQVDKFWQRIAALNAGVFAIAVDEYEQVLRSQGGGAPQGQALAQLTRLRTIVNGMSSRYGGNWNRNLNEIRPMLSQSRAITGEVTKLVMTLPDFRKAPPMIGPPWVWGNASPVARDITVDTREAVLQKFVAAAFPISVAGGASTTVTIPMLDWCVWRPCIGTISCSAKYSWNLSTYINHVNIKSTGIPFDGKVDSSVSAELCGIGPTLTYSPGVMGELTANWQAASEQIDFLMRSLFVEIYVNIPLPDIVGGDVRYTLGWVDLSTILPSPLLSRKLSLTQQLRLPLPGGDKLLTISPTNAILTPYDGYLRVATDISFR